MYYKQRTCVTYEFKFIYMCIYIYVCVCFLFKMYILYTLCWYLRHNLCRGLLAQGAAVRDRRSPVFFGVSRGKHNNFKMSLGMKHLSSYFTVAQSQEPDYLYILLFIKQVVTTHRSRSDHDEQNWTGLDDQCLYGKQFASLSLIETERH